MIRLTSDTLRGIASYLDRLAVSETDTGVITEGHSGYSEVTVPALREVGTTATLRIARLVMSAPDERGSVIYTLEVEV